MKKETTYFCATCYRKYKTLDHFNRYVNLRGGYCSPIVIADGRRRLTANKINGRWELVKKGAKNER